MAYVKIKQHTGDTGTLIKYILNFKKTDYGNYTYGYNCEPAFADIEFAITNYSKSLIRGNAGVGISENNREISAYHIVQSFDYNDDITPDEALQIGIKFANEMFGNEFEYVVATHIDKGHIHNHIAINATSFVSHKKYRSQPYKTIAKMRDISDRLCEQYGFSTIENPLVKKGKYSEKEYYLRKNGKSTKAIIESIIDEAILHSSDFEEFKIRLAEENVLVKEGKNSDYIAFKLPEDKRFTGGKSLGNEYTKESIISRITTGKVAPDPELKISFHEKLLQSESELSYISRIPYTKTFIEFKKSEVTKKGQVYFIKIKPNKIYRIKDENGEEIGTLKGTDFFNHYQDISNYKGRLAENEIEKIIESPKQEAVNDYANQIIRQTKKQRLASINELSAALLYIRKEQITSYDEFEGRLSEHELKLLEYNNAVQKYQKQIILYNKAIAYLQTIQKTKPIHMEYLQMGGRKKEAYYKAHAEDLQQYDLSIKKLDQMGVSGEIGIEKVQASLNKANEIITDLSTQINAEKRRLEKVSDARRVTCQYSNKTAEKGDFAVQNATER